jgi:hypothetical protein
VEVKGLPVFLGTTWPSAGRAANIAIAAATDLSQEYRFRFK